MAICAVAGEGISRADAPMDASYDAAVRMIHKALVSAKATAISQSNDAAPVITALRSAHDPDLAPMFEKISQSTVAENQIYAMVALAILNKENAAAGGSVGKRVDLEMLLKSRETDLVGAAIASLIDAQALSTDELQTIIDKGTEPAHRVMAAAELQRLKKLANLAPIRDFLKDKSNVVRYYAATVMLSSNDPADVAAALSTLKELSDPHDLREAPVQALMLVRMEKEKITAGIPWAAQIVGDGDFDLGLRFTAISTLLSLHAPEGPKLFSDLVKNQHGLADQVKLGLIALAHPGEIPPATIAPLLQSQSRLAKAVAAIAQKAANHEDTTADLVNLIKVGDPIMIDWSLSYSDQLDEGGQIALRTVLANQARIVDSERDNDYEHAAVAVQRLLENDGAAGRKAVVALLQSNNRSVVEAALAGVYRSTARNQAELVLPIWNGLTKTTASETSANYAALILAREGRQEPLTWLPGMIAGGAVQGPGFRALSTWYYAKLTGHSADFLKAILAD